LGLSLDPNTRQCGPAPLVPGTLQHLSAEN
jgi:hypothetical protein